MNNNIYRRLQEKINDLFPFPASPSGVELKILKILFTEEDAEFYMKMSPNPETVEMVSQTIGEEIDITKENLKKMLQKGTVLCMEKNGETLYSPAPYIVGLYENLAHSMDEATAELLEQYHNETFFEHIAKNLPPVLRFIPIQEALQTGSQVFPHDDVMKILKSKKKIAVIDCACRKQVKLTGAPVKPIEVCFSFDGFADYYVNKRKQGRFISLEEAIEIQTQCEQAGLISQSTIIKDHEILCHCDKDCFIFRSFERSSPAKSLQSNYYSEIDSESCIGCEDCVDRCQIKAISMGQDQVAVINLGRCVGCGLCATICPSEAISLMLKPEAELLKELVTF